MPFQQVYSRCSYTSMHGFNKLPNYMEMRKKYFKCTLLFMTMLEDFLKIIKHFIFDEHQLFCNGGGGDVDGSKGGDLSCR